MTIVRRLAWASSAFCLLATAAAAAPPPDAPTAWAAGPLDVVVALPHPAHAADAAGLVGARIPYFSETAKRTRTPLGSLQIAGVALEDDGRTLRLAVDPQPMPARYVLNLGPLGFGGPIAYALRGVEVARLEGDDPNGDAAWTVWLPTPDLAGFRDLAKISAEHARRLEDIAKPGLIRIDSQVDLPPGKVVATVESTLEIVGGFFGDAEPDGGVSKSPEGRWVAKFTIEDETRPAFLSLTFRGGPAAADASVKLTAAGREPEPSSYLPPWASAALASSKPGPMEIPDLTGGDAKRGEAIFFGTEALCSQCHVVKGKGEQVGPDLTTIGLKGAEYIYRSIAAPSETIAPDYVSYTVSLEDGRVAAGVVRAEGPDSIRVTGTDAKSVTFPRDEIDEFRAGATSIMPVGLLPALGQERVRDLIAYLTAAARE